jgi:hypothetical protein
MCGWMATSAKDNKDIAAAVHKVVDQLMYRVALRVLRQHGAALVIAPDNTTSASNHATVRSTSNNVVGVERKPEPMSSMSSVSARDRRAKSSTFSVGRSDMATRKLVELLEHDVQPFFKQSNSFTPSLAALLKSTPMDHATATTAPLPTPSATAKEGVTEPSASSSEVKLMVELLEHDVKPFFNKSRSKTLTPAMSSHLKKQVLRHAVLEAASQHSTP